MGNDACGIFGFGVDVASGVEVFDGGVIDVAERCGILFGKGVGGRAVADGERVGLSVEGAAENVLAAACHAGDGCRAGCHLSGGGEVRSQFYGLAAEVVAL